MSENLNEIEAPACPDIEAKVPGAGQMYLKSSVVKKA